MLAKNAARLAVRNRPTAVYAFDTAAKETFEWAAPHGITRILEQCVVPRAGQERILTPLLHSTGCPPSPELIAAWRHLAAREQTEWALANLIVCPSEYVRSEVISAGGSPDKTCLVPYGVDPPTEDRLAAKIFGQQKPPARPLRVLFAGEVGVRKGILDLAAAALSFSGEECEFVAAGGVSLTSLQQAQVNKRIQLLGSLTRAQLAEQYAAADIFVLPSYLEGSATVTYEALGWGLPVITTRESGSVVEHERSGFIGNAGDVSFLTRSLQTLSKDTAKRQAMSIAASQRASEFDIPSYGKRLLDVFDRLCV